MAANSTSFKKGQVNNPKGRPKAVVDVQQFARTQTKQNIETLMFWRDQTAEPNVSCKAAQVLHEIAWGKPGQRVELTGKEGGPVIYKWMDSPAQVPPQ